MVWDASIANKIGGTQFAVCFRSKLGKKAISSGFPRKTGTSKQSTFACRPTKGEEIRYCTLSECNPRNWVRED